MEPDSKGSILIIFNRHMELRNIINEVFPTHSLHNPSKIVHELNNQGCRCHLCQRIIINENKIIKRVSLVDQESEHTKGLKESFWISFILDYFIMDKLPRKIRFMLPEICIFENGVPTTLITKKKEIAPIKIVKNKEKLNAFQIQNFFTDGYISHNDVKSQKEGKFRSMSREQYYNYWDVLKNECIVLARFQNDTFQMLSMVELTNLFKSKQRQTRKDLTALMTLVNAKDHNQIRVPLEISPTLHSSLFERAKTEAKIINEDIKPKDFMYISERQERIFEDQLLERDYKVYLEYISMKLVLLYSIKTDILIKNALFKFIKAENNGFYLTDIQIYEKGRAATLWGDIRHCEPNQETSPSKLPRKRPTSSPEKLQGMARKLDRIEQNREEKSVSYKLVKQNQRIKTMLCGRPKASSVFKLEPIKSSKVGLRK